MRGASLERGVPGPKDDQAGVCLRFEYDEAFIADLKNLSPYPARYWSPELGGWWFSEDIETEVVQLTLKRFGEIKIVEDGKPDQIVNENGEVLQQEGLF